MQELYGCVAHGAALPPAMDCNGRYCYLNPRRGAMIAVAEAARNVACVGASPARGHQQPELRQSAQAGQCTTSCARAVLGMAEACRAFETPVTGGNVSLYNENPRGAIYPTPVVGMIGVLDDVERHVRAHFQAAGDAILLLGTNRDELGASEYLKIVFGKVAGDVPALDLAAECALQSTLVELAEAGLLQSAHDCSEGGLAVCIAESAMGSESTHFGVEVELHDELPTAALLFGESQGRAVISCAATDVMQVQTVAARHGITCRRIGKVADADGAFVLRTPDVSIKTPVGNLAEVYYEAIPRLMQGGGERG